MLKDRAFHSFLKSRYIILYFGCLCNADACLAAGAWWSVGATFAGGECGENGFIGYKGFFSSNDRLIDVSLKPLIVSHTQ